MSNHSQLVFFNKEGDYLNFNYSDVNDRFEGDILFHENSSDTYKTYGIYMMERIPSFDYEVQGELTLNKFQLFNEWGLHFYGAKYSTQSIISIEPVNNDPNFYSKWIYGDDFEKNFPTGTILKFDSTFLEFNNTNRTYVVVATKKGAIMIITELDNATFENTYYYTYTDPTKYTSKTISGVNTVGVYRYVDNQLNNQLSTWSEPNFYDKYFNGKKLNIVGSSLNDGTVTVKNKDITDAIHFEFSATQSSLPTGDDLVIEVLTRTDLPKIYDGGLTVTSDSRVSFTKSVPAILKPGVEFKLTGSLLNDIFLKVSYIPTFNGTTNLTFYATQSQVLYNNRIYQCVQAYTHSFQSSTTKLVTPEDAQYWGSSTYIPVEQFTTNESLLSCQVYLTTDRFYYTYGWTSSSAVTMASAAQKYVEDLKLFNIDLYYKNNSLRADLIYPSKYAEVNFYKGQSGPTQSIGITLQTNEKLVQVVENLNYELNYDYSSNFKFNIVFTDLDEFGLKITINKMVYQEEIDWIYSGIYIDMQRTIDRTLRNWLARNYIDLYRLGINAELSYIGNFYSPFYNSIVIKTQYPNVPIVVNSVEVGTTADFHIEHSRVLFNDLGPYLNIKINDDDYGQSTIYSTGSVPDINATLSAWMEQYQSILSEYQIYITHINNLLKFDIKELDRRLDYVISTGKIYIPGINDYSIVNKMVGNEGMLIASNEVSLPTGTTSSFLDAGFATGMVFSINNTSYPFNNQEFNIHSLNSNALDLSYQGPFWNLNDDICNSSAFITLAFSLGFGQTGCSPSVGPTAGSVGGPFNLSQFSNMFSISYNPNAYSINYYNLNSYPGTSNLVDIKYIQLSNSIYGFGDDLIVIDSYLGTYLSTISLPGNTSSRQMQIEFNPINNYIYLLASDSIYVVDPLIDTLLSTITLSYTAYDLEINPINGDVYVTYTDSNNIDIWYSSNLTNTRSNNVANTSSLRNGKMVFSDYDQDMYITGDSDKVMRVVGSSRLISTTYTIPGLTHSLFYEPVNESIYVYGSASLWKIDNGVTQSVPVVGSYPFGDILFNNLTSEMNISDSSSNFSRLTLGDSLQTNGVGNYGYLALNQFDGDVYLSSQTSNVILVINPSTGTVVHTSVMSSQTTKLTYNPDRKSVWAIQPLTNTLVEVEVAVNGSINILPPVVDVYGDNQYGTLSPDYVARPGLWLKTREYIRKPRENYEGDIQVQYYYKWLTDNIPEFFIYDLSGSQLVTSGSYSYTGPKPLTEVVLNKLPNKDLTKVSVPEYQQTIFDVVEFPLSYINDVDDFSSNVEPLQLFLGYRSTSEGYNKSTLQLYKKERVNASILTDVTSYLKFETLDVDGPDKRGLITLNMNSSDTLSNKGLKPGQHIALSIKDKTNSKNQYVSSNNGRLLKIREVYTKYLVVDFFNITFDYLDAETTTITDFPSVGKSTYLETSIEVVDREVGRFQAWGQTEVEDERFKIELGNVGKLIGANDTFIFKSYDINEGGVDWTYLNKKRKEMLMMKHLIYPYIGSYKSIINAINFFGYNDLQLNEYYRNVDTSSANFSKLFKVEIPDIFDNTVEGWTENDFIKHTFPNDKFEETNLFNLTYDITDKEGTNVLEYTLDEVVIKLQGLKYWLKRNIIPLTHRILDITGRASFVGGTYITHRVNDATNFNIRQNMTPITMKLNEAYLMPVNSGSTVYNCVVDFYSIIEGVGSDKNPTGLVDPPKPVNGVELILPDYFTVKVRTYKTYKEWAPFTTYNKGDKVSYYSKLYESVIDNNKIKNPRKYENATTWSANDIYQETNIVEYNRDFYVFSGLGSTQSGVTPFSDTQNWLKITEWKEFDLEPVQTLSEYRRINKTDLNPVLPFNFTIDSNLDPFIVIEVTSDNGYGLTYTDKKNYEIRGLKDLVQNYQYIEPIGPFVPISPVY